MLMFNNKIRSGKPGALNTAIMQAKGEIYVFSDANVLLDPSAIKEIVGPFADQKCGAVTADVALVAEESKELLGEGAYMRYEKWIQRNESELLTLIGVDGALYAVRANLVKEYPREIILDDLYTSLNIIELKYRIEKNDSAKAIENVTASVKQEFKRKVRMAAGSFQLLEYFSLPKFIIRSPIAAFMFISHKLIRWLTIFFMISIFVSNIFLLDDKNFQITMILQISFYLLASLAVISTTLRKIPLFYFPYYFCAMNLAFLLGFIRYIRGNQSVKWDKAERS
jgi:cellulose synthase/poly-beta-1,6-N-acetylglucosamine synthase-like glycosyltransferase